MDGIHGRGHSYLWYSLDQNEALAGCNLKEIASEIDPLNQICKLITVKSFSLKNAWFIFAEKKEYAHRFPDLSQLYVHACRYHTFIYKSACALAYSGHVIFFFCANSGECVICTKFLKRARNFPYSHVLMKTYHSNKLIF